MSEERDDKNSPLRLPPQLRLELRQEIGSRLLRGERVTYGKLLLDAWRYYIAAREAGIVTTTAEIAAEASKELPPDLKELVEEFIRFATNPGIEDRNWARHTMELLRERIAERKQKSPSTE